jgi:hypothetical protein
VVRGRALSFCAHNAGATKKARGQPGRMLKKILIAGPPSQGAVSGPDKPCRMTPFRRTPEVVGVGGREVYW